MVLLVGVSASGAREQRRLPREAPLGALESATWGAREQGGPLGLPESKLGATWAAREQVGATWGAREWRS